MTRDIYFEDLAVGQLYKSPGATLSEGQIIEFALKYDPQPFHIDKTAAERDYPFGGLIASGYQTIALAFRLIYQTGVLAKCSLGSPGMESVEWPRPVHPGDTIRSELEVLELRPSKSRPDRGIGKMRLVVYNQIDEMVARFTFTIFLKKRPA